MCGEGGHGCGCGMGAGVGWLDGGWLDVVARWLGFLGWVAVEVGVGCCGCGGGDGEGGI